MQIETRGVPTAVLLSGIQWVSSALCSRETKTTSTPTAGAGSDLPAECLAPSDVYSGSSAMLAVQTLPCLSACVQVDLDRAPSLQSLALRSAARVQTKAMLRTRHDASAPAERWHATGLEQSNLATLVVRRPHRKSIPSLESGSHRATPYVMGEPLLTACYLCVLSNVSDGQDLAVRGQSGVIPKIKNDPSAWTPNS